MASRSRSRSSDCHAGGGLDAVRGNSASEGSAKFRDCVCVAGDIALG